MRCAESIIAAVGSLGLQVRAGVHTGECEVIGGGLGGMAVHIGARVAALAGPGEVLVSGSVRDLMTGSDRHFEGGEPRQLKGVADPWPVYRLVPEDVDGTRSPPDGPRCCRCTPAGSGGGCVAGLAGALVLALAVTGFYVLTRPDGRVVVGENAVGVIGPGDTPRVSAAVDGGAATDRSGRRVRQRLGDQLGGRIGVPHRPGSRVPGRSRRRLPVRCGGRGGRGVGRQLWGLDGVRIDPGRRG